MRRLTKVFISTVSASALAVGLAGPAMASNDIRIKVDPLNWEWEGTFKAITNQYVAIPSTGFTVQPGGGPQQVGKFTLTSLQSFGVTAFDGTLTSTSGESRFPEQARVVVGNPMLGGLSLERGQSSTQAPDGVAPENVVDVGYSVSKQEDPATGKSFYEVKLFAKSEAPNNPPADLALQNLHETQSQGVDSCDVAKTLTPGDDLITGDANDTVCVTLDDGDGSSDDAIVIDTGDGNDTVLIDGDTDANVEVDTGRGNDVVVVDSDADVTVDAGEGHDSVVAPGQATVAGGDGTDLIVSDGRTALASVGDIQCEVTWDGSLDCDDWTIITG